MVIHVLLCITFWHCESVAAANVANPGSTPSGGQFCKVGYRQSWPGQFGSANVKTIESTGVRASRDAESERLHLAHASASAQYWAEVPVINNYLTSLLVFTLSFFNQQAFSKMNTGLAAARGAGGALTNLCYHLIALVDDREKAKNILRLAHAYHHIVYMDFGGKLGNGRAWEMVRDRNLLTQEESVYLSRQAGKKDLPCLSWAVQAAAAQLKAGKVPPPCFNLVMGELMNLRGNAGKFKAETENPIPFSYLFAINLLLYCWALSVGLFFAGFLSVYGSVAYALVVYIFFNLRQIGIQLSEPFGYEPRHLQIQEYLMRGYTDHRQLLCEAPLAGRDTISADGAPPDFCGPLSAKYDVAFMGAFKNAEVSKQMALAQGRFGFPGITEEDREKGMVHGASVVMEVKAEAPAPAPPAPAPTSSQEKRKN